MNKNNSNSFKKTFTDRRYTLSQNRNFRVCAFIYLSKKYP